MSDVPIKANFDGVETIAQDIRNAAQRVQNLLEQFQKEVETFIQNNWAEGEAVAAFNEVHTTWTKHNEQLQATLNGAGQLVSTGNSNLQSTDKALAGLMSG